MRLGWVGLFALCPVLAAPDFFASVANSALSMKGGATLASLDSIPIARLEQQVKRIVGADPSLPLNLTSARDLSDPALLRALLLAGGAATDLGMDEVRGLHVLYDEPYGHATDAAALRAAAAAKACTHLVLAAQRADDGGPLKVAAAGAAAAALGETEGNGTRVSHGVHWYCCPGKSVGFAPVGEVSLNSADASHRDDPLRLSWHLGSGGWRAGEVCDIYDSTEWRKRVWGFAL